jgi:hypothetical protein
VRLLLISALIGCTPSKTAPDTSSDTATGDGGSDGGSDADGGSDGGSDTGTLPDPPVAHDSAPGRYVAAWQWVRTGEHCNRLSQLELQADGAVVDAGWTLCQATWGGYTDVWPIGTPSDGVAQSDSDHSVQGVAAVLATSPETRSARWFWITYGVSLEITWDDGASQRWRITWHEDGLYKLEPFLISESDEPADTWLVDTDGTPSRNDTPSAGGWAYGDGDSPAPDVPVVSGVSDLMQSYYAHFLRWNGYYEAPDDEEGVNADQLNLTPYFDLSSTGVARYTYNSGGLPVYSYLSPVAEGKGIHPRLYAYQTSHDFDVDGNIADGPGHTYSGLLVVDGNNAARGIVFIDQSNDTGINQVMIMSAMAYLDTADAVTDAIE